MVTAPALSIVIPIYCAERFLSQCLKSICAQTWTDFEVLLVDDGSTDNTVKICESFVNADSRFHLICQSNQGVSAARNHGLRVSRGRYVAFVDADDWLDPGMYMKAISRAESENSDVVMVQAYFAHERTGSRLTGPDQKLWRSIPHKRLRQAFAVDEFPEVLKMSVEVWRKLLRRSFLIQIAFQFDSSLSYGEDLCAHFSLLLPANRISLIPIPLYYYRFGHESQVTMKKGGKLLELFDSFSKTDQLLENHASPKEFYLAAFWRYIHTINWIYKKTQGHEISEVIWSKACWFTGQREHEFIETFQSRYPGSIESRSLSMLRRKNRRDYEQAFLPTPVRWFRRLFG